MHSLFVPTLLWGYWANIVYIIGMIAYLTIDTISYMYISLNNTFSLVIYIFLAVIFIIDAVLYTIDWYMYAVKFRKTKDEPIQYQCEFVACIFQNLGSLVYLIGVVLNYNKIRWIEKIFLFYFLGIISFFIESILTLFGWFIIYRRKPTNNPKNNCSIQDIYIYAHILNIIGNLIYFYSIILAYDSYKIHKIINSNPALLVQIFGDIVYLLDAYLYHQCWQELDLNSEQQNLNKFYLKKLDQNIENK